MLEELRKGNHKRASIEFVGGSIARHREYYKALALTVLLWKKTFHQDCSRIAKDFGTAHPAFEVKTYGEL